MACFARLAAPIATLALVLDGSACLALACSMRDARACYELGAYTARNGGATVAERGFSDACEFGMGLACRAVADIYADSGRFGEAAARYGRGCYEGDLRSCTLHGRQYCFGLGVERDTARCLAYLRKACDGGDSMGCTQVAEQLSRLSP